MIKNIAWIAFIALSLNACQQAETNKDEMMEGNRAVERMAFEVERLKDPRTGEIPDQIRMRELMYSAKLPKSFSQSRDSKQVYEPIGPKNIGGRTRAIGIDINNENIILAGGVSGGMWRSTNKGQNWTRVTAFEDHSAVSCIAQDTRPGKTSTWYYGSGEVTGNSASKSFSATYRGNGIYKSTDNGKTWTHLASTTALINKASDWEVVHRIAIDPTSSSEVVLAATKKGIMRSTDGGTTWTNVLAAANADFTDVRGTSTGIFYASISSNTSNRGFWRSTDGINWVNITDAGFPSNHQRTVIAIAPSNENMVYYYSVTPGSGNPSDPSDPSSERQSLWKYTYVSGNGTGSGGSWQNRSGNLPSNSQFWKTLDPQGGYSMSMKVKPDNANILFLGGTNLFRSNNGFANSSQTRQLGGYDADGYSNWDIYEDNQHPDNHDMVFSPGNPNELLSSTDGGLHYTSNNTSSKVIWQSFNNGFQTTQFYGIGIDHQVQNEIVVSGYQDNGSWWTNSADTNTNWKEVMGADGSFCFVENGNTNIYYLSSQNGNIDRIKTNAAGNVTSRRDANPTQRPPGAGYLFIHPYTLDPADNNKMYLPYDNEIWYNSDLAKLNVNQKLWTQIATTNASSITAIAASESNQGMIYVGSSNRQIHRIDHTAGGSSATVTNITGNISSGSYTSCITIDPLDDKKVMVIFSNYNAISIWYSETAGTTWTNIEGNLKGDTDPGVPPALDYIGNGPSIRWGRIIHTPTGPVYMVGTSIGLFATDVLDGANTVWVQQASDVIGNTVIEMIDHRASDGFTVIATHGMGAFKTTIDNNNDITSVQSLSASQSVEILAYPNPTSSTSTLRFTLNEPQNVQIDLLNANGQQVKTIVRHSLPAGENTFVINMSQLPAGVYYYLVKGDNFNTAGSIMKS